jgi:hypothetical protein
LFTGPGSSTIRRLALLGRTYGDWCCISDDLRC